MTSRRKAILLAVAVALVLTMGLSLVAAIHTWGFGTADDAFISFRMARNLADGHGLRFNPDGPRVEAASNFLLTVFLAGAHRMDLSLIQSSMAINLGATIVLLLLFAWCVHWSVGPAGLWAPFALATTSVLFRNSTSGLETNLLALLLFAGVALYLYAERGPLPRRRTLCLSSLVLALVALLRPEGPIYILALGALRAWDLLRRWRNGKPLDLKTDLFWIGGFAAVFLPYTLWRWIYFGSLLPNTYHAKTMLFLEYSKLHSGALYLLMMIIQEPLFPLSVLAGLVAYAIAPTRRLRVLITMVLVQAVFMVLSGGDWPHMFFYGRFLLPAVPLMLWILAEAGAGLLKMGHRVPLGAAILLLAGLNQIDLLDQLRLNLPGHYNYRIDRPLMRQALQRTYVDELQRMPFHRWLHRSTEVFHLDRYHNNFDAVVGLWLRDRYGPGTRLASIQAGQFAFWAEASFFDMFGLVSPEVAAMGRYDNTKLAALMTRFDPKLITFYKWDRSIHNRPLVLAGYLEQRGYGLRYVLHRRRRQAFVIFEKGFSAREPPQDVLFSSMSDLPRRVDPDKYIAALDVRHPRL